MHVKYKILMENKPTKEEIDDLVKDILDDFYKNGQSEVGSKVNSNFVCSICNTNITIKNSHNFIGDMINCKICKLPACNNEVCTIECLHCQDRNICSNCSIKCKSCKGDVCKKPNCTSMLTICEKCKLQYCDDCSAHAC